MNNKRFKLAAEDDSEDTEERVKKRAALTASYNNMTMPELPSELLEDSHRDELFRGLSDNTLVRARLSHYAPCKATHPCKVLAVVQGFGGNESNDLYAYSCKFGDTEVPARLISEHTVEFTTPPLLPGVIQFMVCRKDKRTREVLHTNSGVFFVLPLMGRGGSLSLAWTQLKQFPVSWIQAFKENTKTLDVSFNQLDDVTFAGGFPYITSLVLDNNKIKADAAFPVMPNLHTLSLNRNQIDDLDVLLETLRVSTPNLNFLSLLGNDACPLFTGDHSSYELYRNRVKAALPLLTFLDSSPI